MAISPFKTKYQAMAAYKNIKQVELRCLKDGSKRLFLDDGPFPQTPDGKPVDGWQTRTPQSGRSNLLKKFRQTEADPLAPADDPDAQINLFVFEGGIGPDGKPIPLPKIWDPKIGEYMSPVRMTDHHREVMAIFCGQRNEVEVRASERQAQLKAEQEAKASAGVEALIAKLGEHVAKVPAAKKPAGGAA